MKKKLNTHKVFSIILIVCLLISLTWYIYDNHSKSLNERIVESIDKYDVQYERIITIQFNNNHPYVFYLTTNNLLRIVQLESNVLGGISVKGLTSEISMFTDERQVSWHGVSRENGTNYLYGVIDNPDITQLILESENDQTAIIINVEENKSIWFRFLEDDVKLPVTLIATDKEGNEKYYFGPPRN